MWSVCRKTFCCCRPFAGRRPRKSRNIWHFSSAKSEAKRHFRLGIHCAGCFHPDRILLPRIGRRRRRQTTSTGTRRWTSPWPAPSAEGRRGRAGNRRNDFGQQWWRPLDPRCGFWLASPGPSRWWPASTSKDKWRWSSSAKRNKCWSKPSVEYKRDDYNQLILRNYNKEQSHCLLIISQGIIQRDQRADCRSCATPFRRPAPSTLISAGKSAIFVILFDKQKPSSLNNTFDLIWFDLVIIILGKWFLHPHHLIATQQVGVRLQCELHAVRVSLRASLVAISKSETNDKDDNLETAPHTRIVSAYRVSRKQRLCVLIVIEDFLRRRLSYTSPAHGITWHMPISNESVAYQL